MFIVGLTGGIATGKSQVCEIFREHGIPVIDADILARRVVEPGQAASREIREEFGDSVFQPDGQLDRPKIADIIFSNPEKRKKLNAITHPRIHREMRREALKYFFQGYSFIVMDLPLLFETGKMLNYLHKIIVVTCDEETQLKRLIERSNYSEEHARARIAAQMPQSKKIAQANFVIDNCGTKEELRTQTIRVISVLTSLKRHWYIRGIILLSCSLLLVLAAYVIAS